MTRSIAFASQSPPTSASAARWSIWQRPCQTPWSESPSLANRPPSSRFSFGCSVGAGWMPTPHNYVVQGGVVTDLAQNTRVAPSVALNLSSPAFPPVGALLGLGLGSRRRPDFYLGASLRVLHPVLVNGGVVWQYIAHLPPGVQVGQPAASAGFAQSLSFSYTGRWFWGLSYAP